MMTAQNKIEKFILLYSQKNDPILDFLAQSNAKYVLLGKPAKDSWNVCYVDNDNILAGSDVTSYLVKKGHRHIGFLYDDFSQVVQGDRYLGYQRAVIQEGLNEYHLGLSEPADAIGPPLRTFLKKHPQITAMIATDDLLALQVQRQLAQLHLPQAMSLVGFNNSIFAKVAQPQLTSVEVFPVALGEAVAKMIVNLSQQQNAPNNMITPHQIIERDSVVDLTIGEAN
ncbi:maltose operon transcriptional repressor MalR, LacI family [Agrilactobacillus composti DSM 18527 = JCM 14202]|nr:maltose operon transcriptional repressor MalR, LacI family [Agrilactobacillus composti DSM 18527 = JCM 14202]